MWPAIAAMVGAVAGASKAPPAMAAPAQSGAPVYVQGMQVNGDQWKTIALVGAAGVTVWLLLRK